MKRYYQIYVEGQISDETQSKRQALNLKRKYEDEGWNVRVIEYNLTIIGHLGVQIYE